MEQKIEKIMQMTDGYLERFGKVLIGIYYLSPMDENWRFMRFINSLSITPAEIGFNAGIFLVYDCGWGALSCAVA